ncbi:TIGR00296 family protein [Candidatus Woesearchaeota archaeon]|nr:MAG: TIGR00296 family protein [Candidatus Woesearchaeota archaeon]
MNFSLEQGKTLVKLARSTIFSKPIKVNNFHEKFGVFVTINSYPSGTLRGCIGFPEPIYPLNQGVINAARHAALNDPRFMPVTDNEEVTIEVSILSKPEKIIVNSPDEYPSKINIGKDGLIIEYNQNYGLLLPQVFTEHKVNATEALEMVCEKAGLPRNAWKEYPCKIYKFQAQIFYEKEPNGEILEK